MKKAIIKSGDKFGRLTAVKFDHNNKRSQQYWLFRCDCGIEKVVCVFSVKNGDTKSCGCLYKNSINKRNYKHGMEGTRTYRSWESMKNRCLNKKYHQYKYYGGRGITICPEWINNFINFFKDMGVRPEDKTLDRIDNDGNYCKSNCKYSTPTEQNNNRR